jgi:hypothetical protein
MAGLKSPVLLDVAQESGDQHDGGQRCTNLNTKMERARIMMLRWLRNERSNVGFGCTIRLIQAAAKRNVPAANIATITPEFSQ